MKKIYKYDLLSSGNDITKLPILCCGVLNERVLLPSLLTSFTLYSLLLTSNTYIMSSYTHKWGYGGTETAINGCFNSIQRIINPQRMRLTATWEEEKLFCYRTIMEYGKQVGIKINMQGHLSTKADKMAKQIQKDFKPFVKYLNEVKNKLTTPGTIDATR